MRHFCSRLKKRSSPHATQRQIEAKRRHAAVRHQMTEAGKQAVRGNAISSRTRPTKSTCLPGEDQDFFNENPQLHARRYARPTRTKNCCATRSSKLLAPHSRMKYGEPANPHLGRAGIRRASYKLESCPAGRTWKRNSQSAQYSGVETCLKS